MIFLLLFAFIDDVYPAEEAWLAAFEAAGRLV